MSGHYLRKRARSAGWAWWLAAFSGALLLVSLVFFRLGILDLQALSWLIVLIAALVVLGLLFALSAISRAWRRGDRGGGRAVAALFLGLLVATPFAVGIALAIEHPGGNIAQTAGLSAPQPELSPAPGAPGREPVTRDLLLGRDFRATAAQVYGAAQTAIENSGWEIVEVQTSSLPTPAEGDLGVSGTVIAPIPTPRDTIDPNEEFDPYAELDSDEYIISAVAEMPILGFPSDITIRIVEENGVSFVDVRSQSRDLTRDLGQNRRFIEGFLGRLDGAMEVLQSGAVEE